MRWERSRYRYGLWDGLKRVAFIGKEHGRHRWQWSLDDPPYTCGNANSPQAAKAAVMRELKPKEPPCPQN